MWAGAGEAFWEVPWYGSNKKVVEPGHQELLEKRPFRQGSEGEDDPHESGLGLGEKVFMK